nr:cytochrome c oxidase subunit II [Qipengyuania thermophila]
MTLFQSKGPAAGVPRLAVLASALLMIAGVGMTPAVAQQPSPSPTVAAPLAPPAPDAAANVAPDDPQGATPGNDTAPQEIRGGDGPEAAGADAYQPLGPEWIRGVPADPRQDFAKALTFQDQYSNTGNYALWMHNWVLLPIIVAITLFVLALLLIVIVRYNRRRNAVPSKTTHNTLIEVVWTVVPALLLLVIAIPSIRLLAKQYEAPPENAVTIKATGYQWYWTYTYMDNGEFEIISNMMPEEEAQARGFPSHLEVDNRLVVPVNTPIRLQTTAADVIHSFAVPSLWFKLDAIPGRLNERMLTIREPGIYYGQCSELCGARHAYMPIAIEALPRPQWEAWVRAQGGTLGDEAEAEAGAQPAAVPAATEAAAPAAGAAE